MSLKSNSPVRPSGGDEGDGGRGNARRSSVGRHPSNYGADDEILIFLAEKPRRSRSSPFTVRLRLFDFKPRRGEMPATPRRRPFLGRNSFPRARGMLLSAKSLTSFVALARLPSPLLSGLLVRP